MLKQRVITALILVGILLPTLWADALWPFAILSLVFVAAGGWEWGRLNGVAGTGAWMLGAAVALGCLGLAQVWGLPVWDALPHDHSASIGHEHGADHALVGFMVPALAWWLAAAVWLAGLVVALRWGAGRWRHWPTPLRAALGWAVLLMAWLALTEAKLQGLNLLLSMLCLVWAADIGAYFGGRAFGRRKLAPAISPGKSWEGVVAGAVATQALAWAWVGIDQSWGVDAPSLYSHLRFGLGDVGLVLAVLALTGVSVAGDLFESLIKREAGAKDSSQLLPGHGGVLDRIDALLPVLPVAMALMALCHG